MNILRKRVGQVGYEIIVPDLIVCQMDDCIQLLGHLIVSNLVDSVIP